MPRHAVASQISRTDDGEALADVVVEGHPYPYIL
jgi:hypothetical protein